MPCRICRPCSAYALLARTSCASRHVWTDATTGAATALTDVVRDAPMAAAVAAADTLSAAADACRRALFTLYRSCADSSSASYCPLAETANDSSFRSSIDTMPGVAGGSGDGG